MRSLLHPSRPRVSVLTTLICASAVVRASTGEAPWLKIASPNFELYTNGGERGARGVVRHFEQVRAFFLDAMGLGVKSGPKVRIVVFRSAKEFAAYSPNDFATGFYLGSGDRDYIVLKGASSDNFPVAVHEYTHLLVKHTGIRLPIWFNEGLAEFYSNLKPLGGKVEVGGLIMSHYTLLRQSNWIDLPALLAVEEDSPLYNVRSQAPLFYAESWALVHMLYLSDEYRNRLSALLAQLKAGTAMTDAFQKVYSKSVEQVQRDLRSYISARQFNASLFNTRIAPAADQAEIAEAGELDIRLLLAEIAANTPGKFAQGRDLYVSLAHKYPREWRIEAGLARLSLRERNNAETLAHFAHAAELGSTDAVMYLEYGRLLRADGSAQAVPVLERAVAIDPEDRETHLELGFAYLVNDQHLEALTQFQLAKPVDRERAFEYFHALAYAYYRLNRKTEAAVAAAACRKYANSPDQTARLDQLLAALNYLPDEGSNPETVPADPAQPHELACGPGKK